MRTLALVVGIILSVNCLAQDLWGTLPAGQHSVGFRLMRETDPTRAQRPMVVTVWYPGKSSSSAKPVLFKHYLESRIINATFSEPTESEKKDGYERFHKALAMPHVAGVEVAPDKFETVLNTPTKAFWDLPEATGKFPLVVMRSEPEGLSVTAEYLASNGFVVAAIHAPYDQGDLPESMYAASDTDDITWLLNRTTSFGNVDQGKIAAIGFGGGIQAAFFLTMRSDRIKGLVNLEGGVFGPRSKTDKSINYHPDKMKTPMLHIVAASQQKEDDIQQQRALKHQPLFRAFLQDDKLRHHDISIYGRIANRTSQARTGAAAHSLDQVYTTTHQLILEFLRLSVAGKTDLFIADMRYMPVISLEKFPR